MSRPARARELVLDAFEQLLIDEGPRAATMDAIAHAAGVSKGGLLYHFASKDALVSGEIERLKQLVEHDIAELTAADDGPISSFLRTSIMDDSPIDRALIAVAKLAQGGNSPAVDALRRARARWAEFLRPHTADETALQVVMLVSDGLYFNNALGTGSTTGATADPLPEDAPMEALIALVERATRR